MRQRRHRETAGESRGQRSFARLFSEGGHTQEAVAAVLGVSQQTVSAYARGAARPGDLVRQRIARKYGIEASSWLTATEKRYLAATGTDG